MATTSSEFHSFTLSSVSMMTDLCVIRCVVFCSDLAWARKPLHPPCLLRRMYPPTSEEALLCPGRCGQVLDHHSFGPTEPLYSHFAFRLHSVSSLEPLPIWLFRTLVTSRGVSNLRLLSFQQCLWPLASTSVQVRCRFSSERIIVSPRSSLSLFQNHHVGT